MGKPEAERPSGSMRAGCPVMLNHTVKGEKVKTRRQYSTTSTSTGAASSPSRPSRCGSTSRGSPPSCSRLAAPPRASPSPCSSWDAMARREPSSAWARSSSRRAPGSADGLPSRSELGAEDHRRHHAVGHAVEGEADEERPKRHEGGELLAVPPHRPQHYAGDHHDHVDQHEGRAEAQQLTHGDLPAAPSSEPPYDDGACDADSEGHRHEDPRQIGRAHV